MNRINMQPRLSSQRASVPAGSPTRYTRAELDAQARYMARDAKGKVLGWEIVCGEHVSLGVRVLVKATGEERYVNCAI